MTSADTWPPSVAMRRGGRHRRPRASARRSSGASGWAVPIVLLLVTLAVWVGIVLDAL
ncbi:hypothetical protein PO878_05730 [Iamia majanohamensis]|uniref:Uncharacterized protein n=1 Tax=Iamia majanohamensis TaxID=467976 RepID=A0AAE9Y785_9ACTN|nr:hypothetical protein [Iamia majanohamensis]WCO68225.1 hypothetical protein PO878_05730 [Iamia majanohamensis]